MTRLIRVSYILVLFIAALVTGTYYNQAPVMRVAHHILVTVAVVGGLIALARAGGLARHPLMLAFGAVIAAWLVSAALAVDPRMAFENAWFPISHAAIGLLLVALIQRGRALLVLEGQFMLAAVVALFALVHLGSWYFGWGIAPGTENGWAQVVAVAPIPIVLPQVYLPLGVSTWLAAYCAPLAVLAFAYGLAGRAGVRAGFWALAGLLTIGVLATGSRGGLIALAVGGGAFVLLQVGGQRRGRALWLGAAGALAVVAVAAVLLIGRNVERFTGDALRLNLWRGAVEVFASDPISGVGVGLFGRAYREVREPFGIHDNRLGTAHNAYLNALAENGLIGAAAMLIGGGALAVALWRRRSRFDDALPGGRASRLRWGGAVAALAAFGAQSVVDTFASPPLALLTVTLIALATTEKADSLPPLLLSRRVAPLLLAAGMAIYGALMVASDAAYLAFRRAPDAAVVAQVMSDDPGLQLYRLQGADLSARAGAPDSDALYAEALALAPTWDIGWINRAALAEARGDYAEALEYLDRARRIDRFNGATVHWARIAETHGLADEAAVVDAYALYFDGITQPFSAFWWETPGRRTAVEALVEGWLIARTDVAYRLLGVHDPARLPEIAALAAGREVKSAGDWWVVGEVALERGAAAEALAAFDEAVRLDRRVGDYAAARARARAAISPADPLIEVDLTLAELLGTLYESPNAIRATLATDEAARRRLLANAVPFLTIDQNFEGVSYGGRVVGFTPVDSMREPGLGAPLLQPWFDLEASYLAARDYEAAEGVRRAIDARLR